MDLDYQKRSDLANYFIERYLAYSKDQQLTQLLAFYKCYRAYVRGKVISFRLDDPNITAKEKAICNQRSASLLQTSLQVRKKPVETLLSELVGYPIGNINGSHYDWFLVAIAASSHHQPCCLAKAT